MYASSAHVSSWQRQEQFYLFTHLCNGEYITLAFTILCTHHVVTSALLRAVVNWHKSEKLCLYDDSSIVSKTYYVNSVKVKVKGTLVQALRLCTGRTARRGRRGIALPFHDHGTRREWGVSIIPLYRRLGGTQGRSGQVRKISPPLGFDPRTVQPIASRYTNYIIQPTCEQCTYHIFFYCDILVYFYHRYIRMYPKVPGQSL